MKRIRFESTMFINTCNGIDVLCSRWVWGARSGGEGWENDEAVGNGWMSDALHDMNTLHDKPAPTSTMSWTNKFITKSNQFDFPIRKQIMAKSLGISTKSMPLVACTTWQSNDKNEKISSLNETNCNIIDWCRRFSGFYRSFELNDYRISYFAERTVVWMREGRGDGSIEATDDFMLFINPF